MMELLDKGRHCQEEYCHQLDLLPMKCKACNKYFCSDHFKYESHNCKSFLKLDYKIPICEICNKTIEFKRGHDLDLCLAIHMDKCHINESIEPKSLQDDKKLKTKNKCSFKNCKTKEIFEFQCENCSEKFCVKHRIPEDHGCKTASCSEQSRKFEKSFFKKHMEFQLINFNFTI